MLGLRHRGEVTVAEPGRDALGLDRLGQRQVHIACNRRPEGLRDGQPSVAGVLRNAVEQPFRALEPGSGQDFVAAVDVVACELDGHHRRDLRLSRAGRGRVRALAQLRSHAPAARSTTPHGRRCRGRPATGRPGIGLGQLLERLSPGVGCQRGPPLLGQRRLRAVLCFYAGLARHGAILTRPGKRISALSSGRDDVSRETPHPRATRGTKRMAEAPAAAAAGLMSPPARSSRGRSRTPRGCGG